MEHRGEIIKEAVYESGIPITELAKQLGKSRRWVYQMFDNSNVSLDVVLRIGLLLHYDFSNDIKAFSPLLKSKEVPTTFIKAAKNVAYWKDKYLQLLEEYNDLLKNK